MDAPLISVIVPVYNVEAYLDRCVQSIVDQTYQNLEIILVDDGSPDHCPAMCDAWAKKDHRIKVIHKANGGLSAARNAGMAVSTGEYIGFVDSDDYIAPEMFRLLLERITADGSDISVCGVELVFEDGSAPRNMTVAGSCLLARGAAMKAVIRESWIKQPVWNKLYKADMVRSIPFPVGKYHEDVFWTWQAVSRANSVSVFDTPCYYYAQRSGSIMAEAYSLRRLDAIEAKEQRLAFIEKEFPELAAYARKDLLFSCMHQGQQAAKHLDVSDKKVVLSKLSETAKHIGDSIGSLPFTHKCWVRLAKWDFALCCKLRNLFGVGI